MILQIPVRPIASQTLSVVLDNQQCTIKIYNRTAPASEVESVEPLLVNQPLFATELGIDGFDVLDWLLVVDPKPLTVAQSNNLYMDLYVSGTLVYQGMICIYGSVINQYKSPLFRGYLFMDTIDKADPEYQGFGTTVTLNWTDNGVA